MRDFASIFNLMVLKRRFKTNSALSSWIFAILAEFKILYPKLFSKLQIMPEGKALAGLKAERTRSTWAFRGAPQRTYRTKYEALTKKSPSVVIQTLPRLRIYLLPKPKSDGRSSDFRINLLPAPSRLALQWASGNLRVLPPNTAAGPYRCRTGFPIILKTILK